mgnify:CR=1 FL=1
MKKRKSLWFCISMLFLVCTASFVCAAETQLVRVGAFNYYPAIFKDKDGQIKGFYVDALADLAKQENLRIEYLYGSWEEGFARIKSGDIDLLTSVARTPERETYLDFSQTQLMTVWGEVYVHPSTHIDGILELQGKKVAIMKGSFDSQSFIELTKKFSITCEFIEMSGFEEVFEAVADERVDAGVVSNLFGVGKQKEYGLRSTGIVFNPFDIYFAVAKGRNPKLLALVEKYLHGWRHDKNSVYAQARQKWGHSMKNNHTAVPGWLKNTAIGLCVLVLTAVVFIIALQKQVKSKTDEILQREKGLRESEERYRSIFENNNSVMLIIDPVSQSIVDANLTAGAYYGWTRQQLQQMKISDINTMPSEQIAETMSRAAHENLRHFNFKHRLANGSIRNVEAFSSPIVSNGKKLLFSIIHDVTERKLVEDTLTFLLQCGISPLVDDFFQLLARYLAETLCMDYVSIDRLEKDGLEAQTVAIYNKGIFENNTRYSLVNTLSADIVGKTFCRFDKGVCDQFAADSLLQQLKAESSVGTTLWGTEGKPIGLIAVIGRQPLTDQYPTESMLHMVAIRAAAELERKSAEEQQQQIEEQLRHAQRMEAVGTLAGGIAHDFNNILTAIIGYAHISKMSLPFDAPQRGHIQNITEAANRATHLIRDLLLFSRKDLSNRRVIDLHETILSTKAFLQRIIGEHIMLVTQLSLQPVLINADSQQMSQILINLVTNARDAMPTGGTITISTETRHLDVRDISELGLANGDKYVLLHVADTGTGISQQHLDKIFDPFFTTKEVGQGTGLGLSIVHGIVASHGGAIKVASSSSTGTTLTIYLPCDQHSEVEPAKKEADEPLPRGTETILLAEDSKRIREMVAQVLAEFGYTVITAVDGKDAVRLFTENSELVNLLLFDLVMPQLGGYEAYQQIKQIRPDIPIIFSTGYAPQVAAEKLTVEQMNQLIHKPYAIVTLLKTVRSRLDAQENLS